MHSCQRIEAEANERAYWEGSSRLAYLEVTAESIRTVTGAGKLQADCLIHCPVVH